MLYPDRVLDEVLATGSSTIIANWNYLLQSLRDPVRYRFLHGGSENIVKYRRLIAMPIQKHRPWKDRIDTAIYRSIRDV